MHEANPVESFVVKYEAILTYKGFIGHVEWNPEDNQFICKCLGVKGLEFRTPQMNEIETGFKLTIDQFINDGSSIKPQTTDSRLKKYCGPKAKVRVYVDRPLGFRVGLAGGSNITFTDPNSVENI